MGGPSNIPPSPHSETSTHIVGSIIWDKVFKDGPSEICGRQPLKKLK